MDDAGVDYSKLVLEELNYDSYLKVSELLALQEPRSDPPHHDEMFFIIIHQSFELWFKEMLHETRLLVEHFREGRVSRALKVIKRLNGILEALCQQIQLISTLTPVEFAGFRQALGTGSGFQSVQFREVEFAFGLRDEFFFRFFENDAGATRRLRERMAEPSVYDEFIRALAADGCDLPEELVTRDPSQPYRLNEAFVRDLRRVYVEASRPRERGEPDEHHHWLLVFEAMLDFDMLFAKWRSVHALAVSRTIGGLPGTGGSEGHRFLESRLKHRFFPELWEVRDLLHSEVAGGRW